MKEANKKSKKKVLLTYLILAACLLVIAAVTVTVIFTVGNKTPDLSGDNNPSIEKPNDDDKPNPPSQGDDDNNDNNPGHTPADTETGYKVPVNNPVVSVGYELAFSSLSQYRVHTGIDFAAKAGDNVFAALDGTVTAVVTGHVVGENYVTLLHEDGVITTYRYVDAKDGLKAGDTVKRGDVIGTISSSSGYEFKGGEHLHFEITVNGRPVDPDIYLDLVEK